MPATMRKSWRKKAVLRRLVAAGTRVVQLGYEGTEGAELETVIDMAQQQVFDIAQRHHVEDYSVLADLIQPTMDELDLISVQGGLARGIPTGFEDLDNLTNGLHGGQMIIVAARPGVGKSTPGAGLCALLRDQERQGRGHFLPGNGEKAKLSCAYYPPRLT